MNPNYLWLTEAIELLSFLVLMPAIAIAIAYAAWQRKAAERQPEAVRDGVRRIRRHCLSAVGACEPDECRYQNHAIFLAIGLFVVRSSAIWCVHGLRLPRAFTFLALAQGNTTDRR